MKRLSYKKTGYFQRLAVFMVCALMITLMPGELQSVSAVQIPENSDITQYKDTTAAATTESANVDANGVLGKNSDIGVEVTKSITGTAGKKLKIEFKLKSNDVATIKLKSVYPVIDTIFPFETSGDAYKVVSAGTEAAKQAELEASYSMTARSDLETGYHSVKFIGEYTKTASDGTVADYYVIKTINIYFSGTVSGGGSTTPGGNNPAGGGSDEPDDDPSDDDDDGNDYISSGGGGSDSEATAPKLIITGYETKPEKVMAGDTFKITIHIQNASKSTPVRNGKFLIGNEAGNFLPTSGSNAVFVESIEAGKTGDIEIELKTSTDLAQKNYKLIVKGDFDDGKGNTFSSSENLYLPVYQEVKLGITDVSMTPESIGIGSEGSLMFTINNQGSAGVYNVKVTADDDAVTAEENYVGNIAPNSSAYATLNVVGAKENSEKGTIKVRISYEDSEGNAGEIEQDVACMVGEDVMMDEFEGLDEEFEEESEGIPWWVYVIIAVAAVAVIAGIIVFVVKRRKKRMEALLNDDDDELGEDDLENEDF